MDLNQALGGYLGEALAASSAILFSLSNVTIALGTRKTQGKGANGALLSVFISAGLAACMWPFIGLPLDSFPDAPERMSAMGWFIVAGILATFLGRDLLYKSIQGLGVVQAAAVKRLNPFFSTLLALVVLGEVISPKAGGGIALIALSFGLIIRESLMRANRNTGPVDKDGPRLVDYLFGPGSALAYAFAYIARKFGLLHVADPVLGTLVGAVAGIACYYIAGIFSRRYRSSALGVFSTANRWQVMAGVFMSLGQMAQFGSLQFAEVSRVVMITSSEIFISIFLSVYVFRLEKTPSTTTFVAAIAAMFGVMLIAIG